jgi:hypothetical protein
MGCSYQSKINGDYLTVYRENFPMTEILRAPEGWSFKRITEWRKNCPDHCWRIVYQRLLSPQQQEMK